MFLLVRTSSSFLREKIMAEAGHEENLVHCSCSGFSWQHHYGAVLCTELSEARLKSDLSDNHIFIWHPRIMRPCDTQTATPEGINTSELDVWQHNSRPSFACFVLPCVFSNLLSGSENMLRRTADVFKCYAVALYFVAILTVVEGDSQGQHKNLACFGLTQRR